MTPVEYAAIVKARRRQQLQLKKLKDTMRREDQLNLAWLAKNAKIIRGG